MPVCEQPAVALYRKCGMREAYRAYTLRVPSWTPLVPASGVALAPLTAEDDAALEALRAAARPARLRMCPREPPPREARTCDAVLTLGGYVHVEIAHMHGAL